MKLKNVKCDPNEVAVKSFFLGPAAENSRWLENAITEIFQKWFGWRQKINAKDSSIISSDDQGLAEFIAQQDQTKQVIQNILSSFENEIPKFSPRYMGHMFSEISMPALLGHFITLLHNPNNISPEASKVGTEIETKAIDLLCKMAGYKSGVGHFTSGGTLANFEFLFRARERLFQWLAMAIAAGSKNVMTAAHLGWRDFEFYQNKISSEDLKKYDLLNGSYETYSNINRAIGAEIGNPVLFVPSSKHYSWPKAMHYLGLGESNIRYIELDRFGRASPEFLKTEIEQAIRNRRPILGVVGIAGTTEMGTIDRIDELAAVVNEFKKNEGLNIWFHIDGAYGGFFRSLTENSQDSECLSQAVLASLKAIEFSDSVTLDPHKLGYVPYSSGAFLCQSEKDYFIRSFMGPYIVTANKNLGNYTLEGSRSAAGAVATYASIQAFNSIQGYSKILKRTIVSKTEFHEELKKLKFEIFVPEGLDTNILCFAPVGGMKSLKEINERTKKIYNHFQDSGEYWISKTTLSVKSFKNLLINFCDTHEVQQDSEDLVLLRLTLMNPFTISKESRVDHVANFCAKLGEL